MTDDIRGLLDYLDEAHGAAANGALRVGRHYGIHIYAGEMPIGTTLRAADATLIVAAVNALPELIAALRAVLEIAAEYETWAKDPDIDETDRRDYLIAAGRIRAAAEGALRDDRG